MFINNNKVYALKTWWLALALFAALALAAGCGSSQEDSSASAGQADAKMSNIAPAEEPLVAEETKSEMAADTSAEIGSVSDKESIGGGSPPIAADADGLNRKLIYRANLTMEVEDYNKAQTDLRNLIHLSGGYILQFADNKSTSELGGSFTVKIPSGGFMSFINEMEKIKHIDFQRSMQGTDVTEEYVDLEARLKAKKVVEARLLAFMEKATGADDLVRFSSELGAVQEEMERIQGRIRYLDQNVALSTIELRMYQRLEPASAQSKDGQPFWERMTGTMQSSTEFVFDFLQRLVLFIAGALPVLAILAVFGLPAYWIVRKSRTNRKNHAQNDQKIENSLHISPQTVISAPSDVDKTSEALQHKDETKM